MLMIKRIIILLLALACKIIALPLLATVCGVELLTNSCSAIIGFIVGLFNLVMGALFLYFIGTQNWEMMRQEVIFFIIEGVLAAVGAIGLGTINLVKELLWAIITFNPFGLAKN